MKAITRIAGVVLLSIAGGVFAEGGPALEPAPAHRLDMDSLQRGAGHFVNYCLNCHSAQYMRYNRLTGLGLTEQQIKDNLMFATDKFGSPMVAAMSKADGVAWFGAPPPDLSVEARVRGKDWLYSYLLGFYQDAKSTTGWNNLVFPSVAMPHVLWQLQGTQRLVETEYEDHEKAEAAVIAARHSRLRSGCPTASTWSRPWRMRRREHCRRSSTRNLWPIWSTTWTTWRSRCATNASISASSCSFILVCCSFAYALKRAYWKDVH
jgi:ubiquinol-cytochrome c reductase cytochrome c1 subunit